MITCELCGGCGNQLFQIFTALSYSLTYNLNLWFLDKIIFITNPQRYTYWHNLLIEIKENCCIYNSDTLISKQFQIFQEKSFIYEKIPPPSVVTKQNEELTIYLRGYFQSYKYFEEHYQTIYNMFNFDKKKYVVSNKFINYNKLKDFNFVNTASIHFRMGDYKKNPNIHPIVSYEYYKNSIQHILNNDSGLLKYILFFHENNNDEDIQIVKNNVKKLKNDFPSISFLEVNDFEDWEELLLMSCCHHNIIANSTFSWWGGYLNSNPNKIVIYPKIWFGGWCEHNTQDLFPNNWICNES